MGVQFSNNALSTLTAGVSAVATTLTIDVSTASKFPQPVLAGDWFPLTLVDPTGALEILRCTARAANVLTVQRAQEGTTARAFPAYTTVELRPTAQSLFHIMPHDTFGTVAALQAASVDASLGTVWLDGYTVPGDGGGGMRMRGGNVFGAVQSFDGAWWEVAGTAVSPKAFGIPQGSDQTALLQAFVDYTATRHLAVDWPDGGDYRFTELAISSVSVKSVIWRCDGTCTLTSLKTLPASSDDDYAIKLRGGGQVAYALTADAQIGQDYIQIADVSIFAPGDICELRSTRLIQTENRGTAREGQTGLVRGIDIPAGRVYLEDCLHYFAPANDTITSTVAAVTSTTEMTLAASIDRQPRDMMRRMTMTSGAQAGESRYIIAWNNTTKVAKFASDQAWGAGILAADTCDLDWSSAANRSVPIKVSIKGGLRLTRAPHLTGNQSAPSTDPTNWGFCGLRVQTASLCDIEGATVDYFSHANIALLSCYRPRVVGCNASWANRLYTDGNGTGYGIAVNQCYQPIVEKNYGRACRRLVDFGGSQAITWYGRSIGNRAEGGGKNYAGLPMFPENPDMMMQVSGSHGSAHGTVYDGDTGVHVFGLHNLRGLREYVKSGYCLGYHRQPVLLHSGGGHTVEGVHHNDMFTEVGKGASTRYAVASHPEIRPSGIVTIWCDTMADAVDSLTTRIFNCTASKVLNNAISLTRGVQTDGVFNLEFGNIRVHVSDEAIGSETEVFRFIRTDTVRNIKNFIDLGGNAYTFDGVEFTDFALQLYSGSAGGLVMPDNDYVKLAYNKFTARILDNGAVAIPVGKASAMARVSIYDQALDRTYRGVSMLLGANRTADYSPLSATNKTSVIELSNAILDGTIGNPGKVTISFRPTAGFVGYLYVENKTGATITPIIEIDKIW